MRAAGVRGGDLVAVVVHVGGLGLATSTWSDGWAVDPDEAAAVVAEVERELAPRWAMWSSATAVALAERGVRLARSWDAVAVHRLLFGGWRADPGRVWARLHG